jgi:hypothetical protein
MNGRDEKRIHDLIGNPKEENLRGINLHGKTVLKWILEKVCVSWGMYYCG